MVVIGVLELIICSEFLFRLLFWWYFFMKVFV